MRAILIAIKREKAIFHLSQKIKIIFGILI